MCAMLFMDGFDYLTAGNTGLKWDVASVNLVTGIFGLGKGVSGNVSLSKLLPSNVVTGFLGFDYFTGTINTSSLQLCVFGDGLGSTQVDLRIDSTGALFFTRNGTTIGSVAAPSTRLVSNTWYWIEVQVTIDPSAGVANVNVNGNVVLAQSGLNTRNTANSYFNRVSLVGGGNQTQVFDSFHCWDTTAGDVSAFGYGEHLIDSKLANAVGSNTTWTRGGTNTGNNYSQVNEANEDGDTTYVTTNTPNNIDSYGFASVTPASGTIGTIAVNTIDRIDDAGPHTVDHYVKSGGSSALGPGFSPSATYNNHQAFFGTDPATSVAWTLTGRNAAEFGYKFIS